jgi:hypothetical protein
MPPAVALNEGGITAQAIGSGGGVYELLGQNGDARIWCGGESDLTVIVQMTGAAVGDLGVQVNPYAMDHATVIPMPLPVSSAPATNPAFAGGKVYFVATFDVSGYDMVRVRLTNNNAGGQTIDRASWSLGPGG